VSDIALEMDNVSKKFRRGQLHDTLRDLVPSLAKSFWRGRASDELGQKEFWALRDVTFRVRRGEALGIIGSNGAGKSTILKILTGIMNPTSGVKTVNGTLSALIEVGAGFHPDLTGRENVFLNGTILGMSRRQIRSKLDAIIDFSGIGEFIDTPVKRYSSGMYARLGFSIACHVDPEVLVVDEVLSVGDWSFQNRSMDKMKSIISGGATVIFVSHNLKAIASLCEKVVYLDHGRVVAHGNAREVVEAYIERSSGEAKSEREEGKHGYISRVGLRSATHAAGVFEAGDHAWVDVVIASPTPNEPLIVAISVRDEQYNLVFYVDTAQLSQETLVFSAHASRSLSFELALHLAPGTYFVNVAVSRQSTMELVDHLPRACHFVVHSSLGVKGVANLYPRLAIDEPSSAEGQDV
jgi:ABC-type polysaccharide/polyol phosphate transport system ATPase subunit